MLSKYLEHNLNFISTLLVFLSPPRNPSADSCCSHECSQRNRVRLSFPSLTVCTQSRELAGWASNMRMWQ